MRILSFKYFSNSHHNIHKKKEMKDAPHYPINANVFYGDLYKMWVSFKLIMELMENMIFPDF